MGMSHGPLLSGLPAVSAAEAGETTGVVRLRPEVEPTVRLLEQTPRETLLEEVAARIRNGLSYQDVVAALMLAGVRNIQPRPSVGFKFHAVLVVNSAHLASLASPDADRWLPIFWSLDYFKDAQARDVREGNWTMEPVDERTVPAASRAREAFVQAMERWDEAAADAAVAALARTAGADETFELFYRFGCRDFRSIGHKAIFVANAKRTLDCIGWQHSEPVLRSLAYALLNHSGEPNPATSDLAADAPGRRNQERLATIRPDWLDGKLDSDAAWDLLAVLRSGSSDDACDRVVELLNRGVAPQSIWDALLAGSGELLMRQPGIVSLHAVTTSNALRYAYATSGNPDTRRMALLQNAAFLPLFRAAMQLRGDVSQRQLDQLEPFPIAARDPDTLDGIFADVSGDRMQAARKVLAYLREAPAESLINQARRLVFLHGTDSHDYKFSSAVLEDYYHMSPEWRDRYLATAVFRLRGSGEPRNPIVERTRVALHG
jgi:hypothetical protein